MKVETAVAARTPAAMPAISHLYLVAMRRSLKMSKVFGILVAVGAVALGLRLVDLGRILSGALDGLHRPLGPPGLVAVGAEVVVGYLVHASGRA